VDLSIDDKREILSGALLDDDVREALWRLVDSGLAEAIVPELPALRLEQDPIHKHKDVLSHTIAVTAQTRADLRLRIAIEEPVESLNVTVAAALVLFELRRRAGG